MEGGSTATVQVTGGDAATLARVLRKTSSMPLAKLCAQIRQENYREWARWEKSLDFHDTMAGRYGLTCPDQESFTFAAKEVNDAMVMPVASYWKLRMQHETSPASVPATRADDLPLFSAADERRALAQDCAQDLSTQLTHICLRASTDPSADMAQLDRDYDRIAHDICDAEAWLGFSLGLRALQVETECLLMAAA